MAVGAAKDFEGGAGREPGLGAGGNSYNFPHFSAPGSAPEDGYEAPFGGTAARATTLDAHLGTTSQQPDPHPVAPTAGLVHHPVGHHRPGPP
jgi:hypothetical protein